MAKTIPNEDLHASWHWGVLITGCVVATSLWWIWPTVVAPWIHSRSVEAIGSFPPATPKAVASSSDKPVTAHLSPSRGSASSPESIQIFVDVAPPDSASPAAEGIAQLGQSGDAFGSANALFSALAGALLLWAGWLQTSALREARKAYQEERLSRGKQQFESTFFQLLTLTRDLLERIERNSDSTSSVYPATEYSDAYSPSAPRKGRAALDSFAASLHKNGRGVAHSKEAEVCHLVKFYMEQIYDKHPSALGPYFRLLFQTFKHIANSDLLEKERIRYANIARGQISEGAVLLLAVNGLGAWGYKFIAYIERFGLLEHMHREYLSEFRQALRTGYRERAFQGSEDRGEGIPDEPPLKEKGYFYKPLQEPITPDSPPSDEI